MKPRLIMSDIVIVNNEEYYSSLLTLTRREPARFWIWSVLGVAKTDSL